MLKNYLKTAWRNLYKNKVFSLINILGLALGMGTSLLIILWVSDERSIDAFHETDAHLYSVYERQYHDGQIDAGHYTPGMLAEEMKLKFPEVRLATSMAWNDLAAFEAGDKIINEDGNYGSPDFFKVFSYKLIEGDPENALKLPTNIAVSRKMATDFFGSPENAIGKSIRYQNRKDLTISAVFENVAANSSYHFDYILTWETFLEGNRWAREWGNNGPSTFLVLHPDTDVDAFRSKIKSFIELYNKEENFKIELDIQKYSSIYLNSNFKDGELAGGRIQYVILFSMVAAFILLIACINFMNLSTARSIKRAREIGIRKAVGAIRWSLIRQFIGEAMVTTTCAFVIALGLVWLILPFFNQVTHKQVTLPSAPLFWVATLSLAIMTGLVAGSYPAFYLSAFKPASVLKGTLRLGNQSLWMRKGLVIFQFVLSIILIIGTMVVSMQVNFVQSINLGYNRENLIYIPLEGDLTSKYELFKQQLLGSAGIQAVTRITQNPTSINNGTGGVQWEGKDPSSMIQFTQAAIGYDFTKSMQVEMAQGRDFSVDFPSDSDSYIVNESAVKIFNYKNPVGMPITFWQNKGTIVGVIKDFHFNSMHQPINPLVLRLGERIGYGIALVRTEPGKTKEALASLETVCKTLNPKFPFSYKFSDQEYQKLYKSEEVVGRLSNVFASLGVFISCLGLLGLTIFTTEQRNKEIGIRKVLGANVITLFGLLSREILILVAISLIIASPLAWYVMKNWLDGYAYHVGLTWWIFAISGLSAIIISLATVSFHTIKALLVNPVNSLRTE